MTGRKIKRHFQNYKDLLRPPAIGSLIKGRVIDTIGGNVIVDLENYKTGILSKDDLKFSLKTKDELKEGDEIEVKIVGEENKLGFIPVSFSEAKKDLIWEKLKKMKEDKEVIKIKVMSANKGGLLFNIFGIQAFLPVSQLSKENYPKLENPTPEKVFKELQKFAGKEMDIQVITVEKEKNNLIVKEAEKEK